MDYKKLSRITDSAKVQDSAFEQLIEKLNEKFYDGYDFWEASKPGTIAVPSIKKVEKFLEDNGMEVDHVQADYEYETPSGRTKMVDLKVYKMKDSSKVQDSGSVKSLKEVLQPFAKGNLTVAKSGPNAAKIVIKSNGESTLNDGWRQALAEAGWDLVGPKEDLDGEQIIVKWYSTPQGNNLLVDSAKKVKDSAKSFFEEAKEKIETALDEGEEYVEFESEFSPEEFDLANLEDWVEETTEQMVKASIESEGGIYKVTLHYEDI